MLKATIRNQKPTEPTEFKKGDGLCTLMMVWTNSKIQFREVSSVFSQ